MIKLLIIIGYIIGYIISYKLFRNYTRKQGFKKYGWGNILWRGFLCLFYPLTIFLILIIVALPGVLIMTLIEDYNDLDAEISDKLPKPPKRL